MGRQLHDEIIAELGRMRDGLVEEVKPLCTDAVKEYFDEHDVDSDTQGEILEAVDGCCVEEVKVITDRYQDEILRKVRVSPDVIEALSPLVEERWAEAGDDALRERMAVTDPRQELIAASKMAIYPKHLQGLGKSKDEAIKAAISSKWGQYWNCDPEPMVRETLLNAPWVRADSTVHAYLPFGPVIGFEGKTGNPAHLHRAELTNADPPEMHGHPRVSQGDD